MKQKIRGFWKGFRWSLPLVAILVGDSVIQKNKSQMYLHDDEGVTSSHQGPEHTPYPTELSVESNSMIPDFFVLDKALKPMSDSADNEAVTEPPENGNYVEFQRKYPGEFDTIRSVAERLYTACYLDGPKFDSNLFLSYLLAIRTVENGKPDRAFGVIPTKAYIKDIKVTRGVEEPQPYESELEKQASWSGMTVLNARRRWNSMSDEYKGDRDFIDLLGNTYSPTQGATDDPTGLNRNWKKNMRYWISKYQGMD